MLEVRDDPASFHWMSLFSPTKCTSPQNDFVFDFVDLTLIKVFPHLSLTFIRHVTARNWAGNGHQLWPCRTCKFLFRSGSSKKFNRAKYCAAKASLLRSISGRQQGLSFVALTRKGTPTESCCPTSRYPLTNFRSRVQIGTLSLSEETPE